MPNRFSTEAANADLLVDDTDPGSALDGTVPQAAGADATSRDRPVRGLKREVKTGEAQDSEAKPGQDSNAGGFIKDKDSDKS